MTPSADFECDIPFSDAVTDREGVRREECAVRSGLKCEPEDTEDAAGRVPLEDVDALRPVPVVEIVGVGTVDTSLAWYIVDDPLLVAGLVLLLLAAPNVEDTGVLLPPNKEPVLVNKLLLPPPSPPTPIVFDSVLDLCILLTLSAFSCFLQHN